MHDEGRVRILSALCRDQWQVLAPTRGSCSSLPTLLLLALIACGDKRQAEPVAPTNGSSPPVVTAGEAADAKPEKPSRIALRASGKPPVKSTKPLARDQLSKLSALELPGLARTVRKLDDAFLDVGYLLSEPPIKVGVTAQP